jgi:hypothetical protein
MEVIMTRFLRIILLIIGIYLIFIGVLYVLAPSPAESLLQVSLPDRATAMIHGATDLAIAFLCLAIVVRGQIRKGEYQFLLVFGVLHVLTFALLIPLDIYTTAQALPPAIIWTVLTALLGLGGSRQELLT